MAVLSAKMAEKKENVLKSYEKNIAEVLKGRLPQPGLCHVPCIVMFVLYVCLLYCYMCIVICVFILWLGCVSQCLPDEYAECARINKEEIKEIASLNKVSSFTRLQS